MTGGVGILRAEGGSEGIDIAESHGIGLCRLTGRLQSGWSAFRRNPGSKSTVPSVLLRHVGQIHGRHLEHLSGALAVASGDQRRVHIDKALLLEKFMDRIGDQGTHTEHRLEGIGPGAQMGDGPSDTQSCDASSAADNPVWKLPRPQSSPPESRTAACISGVAHQRTRLR